MAPKGSPEEPAPAVAEGSVPSAEPMSAAATVAAIDSETPRSASPAQAAFHPLYTSVDTALPEMVNAPTTQRAAVDAWQRWLWAVNALPPRTRLLSAATLLALVVVGVQLWSKGRPSSDGLARVAWVKGAAQDASAPQQRPDNAPVYQLRVGPWRIPAVGAIIESESLEGLHDPAFYPWREGFPGFGVLRSPLRLDVASRRKVSELASQAAHQWQQGELLDAWRRYEWLAETVPLRVVYRYSAAMLATELKAECDAMDEVPPAWCDEVKGRMEDAQ